MFNKYLSRVNIRGRGSPHEAHGESTALSSLVNQSAWWRSISSLFGLFHKSSPFLRFCCYCSTPCCSLLGIEMTSSSGDQQPSEATDNG